MLSKFPAPWDKGVLAQLVERLNGIEEVRGSNPLGSTPLYWVLRGLGLQVYAKVWGDGYCKVKVMLGC